MKYTRLMFAALCSTLLLATSCVKQDLCDDGYVGDPYNRVENEFYAHQHYGSVSYGFNWSSLVAETTPDSVYVLAYRVVASQAHQYYLSATNGQGRFIAPVYVDSTKFSINDQMSTFPISTGDYRFATFRIPYSVFSQDVARKIMSGYLGNLGGQTITYNKVADSWEKYSIRPEWNITDDNSSVSGFIANDAKAAFLDSISVTTIEKDQAFAAGFAPKPFTQNIKISANISAPGYSTVDAVWAIISGIPTGVVIGSHAMVTPTRKIMRKFQSSSSSSSATWNDTINVIGIIPGSQNATKGDGIIQFFIRAKDASGTAHYMTKTLSLYSLLNNITERRSDGKWYAKGSSVTLNLGTVEFTSK